MSSELQTFSEERLLPAVRAEIARGFKDGRPDPTDHQILTDDDDFDSLCFIELLFVLETEFGIFIPESALTDSGFESINAIAATVLQFARESL